MILIKKTKNIKEIKVVIFQAVLIFFIAIALLKNINLNVKFTDALYQINVYLIC